MCRSVVASVALCLLTILIIAGSAAAEEHVGERYEGNPTAIVNVTVIDVSDGTATPHQSVVIRYGKIAYIKRPRLLTRASSFGTARSRTSNQRASSTHPAG